MQILQTVPVGVLTTLLTCHTAALTENISELEVGRFSVEKGSMALEGCRYFEKGRHPT